MIDLRKRGFTLIELIIVVVIMLLLVGMIFRVVRGCAGLFAGGEELRTTGSSPNEEKLRAASQITIIEKVASMSKHYDLYVDGKKVGEVTGKLVTSFGDVFTLKTVDGKRLAYEEECKRWLKLNRAAICHSGNGAISGYIGEESSDFFSWSYVFHFYDENKTEVGTSKKLGKSTWNKHKLYDNRGNEDYDIDKKFRVAGLISDADKYVLTVLDRESEIPLEYAIFIVCIEDAIADAH